MAIKGINMDQTVSNTVANTVSERHPEPFVMIIFGAAGDLSHRKLFPALYNLVVDQWLPDQVAVVGVARQKNDSASFRASITQSVKEFSRRPVDDRMWSAFEKNIHYVEGDFGNPEVYAVLKETLGRIESELPAAKNRLFYLATPPSFYPIIADQLGRVGLNQAEDPSAWVRIVVEKPFGRDLESAETLNRDLHQVFEENQIFRIDHYLGKETVQNILVFRFANGIFEPLWNRRYIDHVQITVSESLGIEGRGTYYDHAGAIRDMIQNHMMQLLCLIAMEPPVANEADAVRDEKVKVLRAIHPFSTREVAENTVRAQYEAGTVGSKSVVGYLDEPDVSSDSRTETYVALRLMIDNWRWAGVPFFLRTGKHLAKRMTEIVIQFKGVPHPFFRQSGSELEPNQLILKIQPDEGISLRFGAKVPGAQMRVRQVNMDFLYDTSFADAAPEAYERLLLDAMFGDSTLFTRKDEVETAWALVSSILRVWDRGRGSLPTYEAGSWGPAEADELIERDGFSWRRS
jgi:glucose-6-phosphate 1-dehydrogenase